MASIIKEGETLRIGANLVDAFTGAQASHGELKLANGRAMKWTSTKPIAESERLLRKAAREDGVRIVLFISYRGNESSKKMEQGY